MYTLGTADNEDVFHESSEVMAYSDFWSDENCISMKINLEVHKVKVNDLLRLKNQPENCTDHQLGIYLEEKSVMTRT